MIKSIVLAIDGSVHAKRAQTVAIDLASKYEAQLTLVHVLTHDHPPTELARMTEVARLSDSRQPRENDNDDTYSTVARFVGGSNEAKAARVITLLGEQIIDKASGNSRKAGVKNVTT